MNEIPEVCFSGYQLTYHPVYRISLFIHLIISIFSLIPLIYFVVFKLFKTGFHGNLKFLLASYFISVSLFSIDFAAISLSEILIPFFANHPCDLLIPSKYLKIVNSSVSFFMTLSTFFPVSITIERFIAMKSAENYEEQRVISGPILSIFNILLDAFTIYLIYRPETFEDGAISFVFFPKTLAPKMFIFFGVMLLMNFINLIFNTFLLRKNNRIHNSTSTLTSKYQREEVYQSTKFAIFVIFCHFLLFSLYIIGIFVLRYFGSFIVPDSTDLLAVRGAFSTMMPVYNLVVGSVAVYLNHKIKMKKNREIAGTIRLEATGNVGARNYDNAILDIWNSVSTK
ncbi:unnamed protein product [Caenorhabditis brenneri]